MDGGSSIIVAFTQYINIYRQGADMEDNKANKQKRVYIYIYTYIYYH